MEDMERGRQGSVTHIFGIFINTIPFGYYVRLIVMLTAVFSGREAPFGSCTSSHAILYVVSIYEIGTVVK